MNNEEFNRESDPEVDQSDQSSDRLQEFPEQSNSVPSSGPEAPENETVKEAPNAMNGESLGQKKVSLKAFIISSIILFVFTIVVGVLVAKLLFKDSADVEAVKPMDVSAPEKFSPESVENQITLLYTEDGYSLKKYHMPLKLEKTFEQRYRQVIKIYFEGPYKPECTRFFGKDMDVSSDFVQGNILILTMPKEFMAAFEGLSLGDTSIHLYSFVNSLLINVPEIAGVQLLIAGEPVTSLNGLIDLSNPLIFNGSLIKTRE